MHNGHSIRDIHYISFPILKSYSVRVMCEKYQNSFNIQVKSGGTTTVRCPYCGKRLKITLDIKYRLEEEDNGQS